MLYLFRQRYNFAEGEAAQKYEIFLRKHILEGHPSFYGVIKITVANTPDGEMAELELTTTVDDPALEIVAECVINNQIVYLWRDRCWLLARTENNELAVAYRQVFNGPIRPNIIDQTQIHRDKTIIVYPVGRSL